MTDHAPPSTPLPWPIAVATLILIAACSRQALPGPTKDAGPGGVSDAPGADGSAGDAPGGEGPPNPCPPYVEPAGGSVAAGAPCTSTAECLRAAGESFLCEAADAADVQAKVQRCHRFARVADGASCAASRTATGALKVSSPGLTPGATLPAQAGLCDARDGLTCDGVARVCAPFALAGADCTTRACAIGLHCGPDAKCAALVPVGAPCDVGAELDGASWCNASSYCELFEKLCVARVGEGAACSFAFQCATSTCRNGVCGPLGSQCIP